MSTEHENENEREELRSGASNREEDEPGYVSPGEAGKLAERILSDPYGGPRSDD